LIKKRTQGLMQPDQAKKIEQATRRDFPQGIPAFGTDALRFTYCALASIGRDIRFDLGRIEGYRNFCNKLWNATRYVLMNIEGHEADLDAKCEVEFGLADRWIQSQLQQTIQSVAQNFSDYRFDLLAQTLYEFTWNEYCDWYLEFSKPVLTGMSASAAQRRGTRQTLIHVLETLLRLMHPFIPFITEEIWQQIGKLAGKKGATIMLQPYPIFDASALDINATAEVDWLKKIILCIRQIRAEMNIAPGKLLPLLLKNGNALDHMRVEKNEVFLKTLAKLESISWLPTDALTPPSATAWMEQLELFIPMAGLIDKGAELLRLQKELIKLEKDLMSVQTKLENSNYVAKAPADVVAKERIRATEMQETIHKLKLQQQRLAEI
jgi:valyl-tRNA synthetase